MASYAPKIFLFQIPQRVIAAFAHAVCWVGSLFFFKNTYNRAF